MTAAAAIAAAFIAACLDELEAPKPGNVHVFAPGRKSVELFRRSAELAAGPLAAPQAGVGTRIVAAVEATMSAIGTNTNLGIILLCAPLAAAAERTTGSLRSELRRVLDDLDTDDAALAFRAIARAAPGGLGRADRHDVFAPATVTLRDAMAQAAGRDRIARQYVSAFDDVFSLGGPALEVARARWDDPRWATLSVFLRFLSAFHDTHVVREHGAAVAEDVRRQALSFTERLAYAGDPGEFLTDILAWDRTLKARMINPGTSADLTVATLFAQRLRNILPFARNNG